MKTIYHFCWIFVSMSAIGNSFNDTENQSLNEIMRALSDGSEQIQQGISDENYTAMQLAAKKVLQRSKVPTDVMAKSVEELGAEVMRYKDFETAMYYQAKYLLKAIEQRNIEKVSLHYHQLLQQCHDCHAIFFTPYTL